MSGGCKPRDGAGAGASAERARPDAEAGANRNHHGAFAALALALARERRVDDLGRVAAEFAADAVGAEFCSLGYLDPDLPELRVFHSPRLDPGVAAGWVGDSPEAATPLAEALRTGRPVVCDDRQVLQERYPAAAAQAAILGAERLAAYAFALDPGLPKAAIGFGWTGLTVDPSRDRLVAPVVALCGAALTRGWAAARAIRLAGLMGALLEEAPVGIGLLDTELRFVQVNTRLAAINGRPVAEHVGETVRSVVPDLADAAEPVLREVIATGRPSGKFEITGTTAADPDHPHIWEEWFVPVTADDGSLVGVLTMVEDVTERHRSRVELERRLARERRLAARLQKGLLPGSLPPLDGYDLAARYVAGSDVARVGGDWYDLRELDPGRFALVVGDVVGHDLGAALTMNELRHVLAGIGHLVDSPARVLEQLDEFVRGTGESEFVATLLYGLFEPATGRLTFSCAGHPPPLLVLPDGSVEPLESGRGAPLGVGESPRPAVVVGIDPGATLVLYTDGLFEGREEPVEAGFSRLMTVAARRDLDVEAYVDILLREVPAPDHADDIALLVVRRRPA